jgi:uncharacterized membrane protein YphA (DoxX/SURF4 family)
MKSMIKNRQLLSDVISALFVLLFAYAAISKLADFQKFQAQIGQSSLLAPFAGIVTWLIPTLEVLFATLLTIRKFQLTAMYLSFTLMAIFTFYVVIIQNFSEYIPCSCGGILQNMNWHQHLVFNIYFMLLAFVGVLIFPYDQMTIAIEGEAENLKQSRQ